MTRPSNGLYDLLPLFLFLFTSSTTSPRSILLPLPCTSSSLLSVLLFFFLTFSDALLLPTLSLYCALLSLHCATCEREWDACMSSSRTASLSLQCQTKSPLNRGHFGNFASLYIFSHLISHPNPTPTCSEKYKFVAPI